MDLVQRLKEAVGADYVSTSPDICQAYSYSCFLGRNWVSKPDLVVMPQTTEQVSQVVKLANEFKVPIRFIGVGEKIYDLQEFHAGDFVNALFE